MIERRVRLSVSSIRRRPTAAFMVYVLAAAVVIVGLGGCTQNEGVAAVSSKSVPYQEYTIDPITLTTIRTIAVLPFENRAPTPGFDGEQFAVKFANQLGGHGQFRVIYPQDFVQMAERRNRAEDRRLHELRTRQRLGLPLEEAEIQYLREAPRPRIDPSRLEDALRLARQLEADAVITGFATDFDSSMRPRLAINYSLTATGFSESAARAVAAMTMSGVPQGGGGHPRGTIYTRQQVFDAREGNVNNSVRAYTTVHVTDNHPDGYTAYLSSMPNYYDICGNILAASLAKAKKDAIKEAERLAKNNAHRQGYDANDAARRLADRLQRDADIPDTETALRGAAYYDRNYPNAQTVLSGEDARIRSWRPEEAGAAGGLAIRRPVAAERAYRDAATGPDARNVAAAGYAPDADMLLEHSLSAGRDDAWRPEVYNRANPDKALRWAEEDARRPPTLYE